MQYEKRGVPHYFLSFRPLWHLLVDRSITKTELSKMIGCSSATITKMGRNEYVALEVIERICIALHCQPGDVIELAEVEMFPADALNEG